MLKIQFILALKSLNRDVELKIIISTNKRLQKFIELFLDCSRHPYESVDYKIVAIGLRMESE